MISPYGISVVESDDLVVHQAAYNQEMALVLDRRALPPHIQQQQYLLVCATLATGVHRTEAIVQSMLDPDGSWKEG